MADVCNPEDLAAKIIHLMENDELREEMGKRSRNRLLENFSIEAYISNYSAEYERLVGRK